MGGRVPGNGHNGPRSRIAPRPRRDEVCCLRYYWREIGIKSVSLKAYTNISFKSCLTTTQRLKSFCTCQTGLLNLYKKSVTSSTQLGLPTARWPLECDMVLLIFLPRQLIIVAPRVSSIHCSVFCALHPSKSLSARTSLASRSQNPW